MYVDLTVAKLMAEAAILGDSFARAGNQWNPDTQANVGANVQVQRNVVMGGVTVPLTLIERAGANLATTASATTAPVSTSAGQKTCWWDGAAGDYTITAVTGVVGTKKVTADGRNYVNITDSVIGDVITCTRDGGATNTHLQVEEVDNPTSKIALGGTRSECDKRGTLTTGDAGTLVMLFQPYGWTQNLGPNDAGVQYFRETVHDGDYDSHIYFAKSSEQYPIYSRADAGSGGSASQAWIPRDGRNILASFAWSTDDVRQVRISGRGWEEFTDGQGSAPPSAIPGTSPITVIASLDLGSWASAVANRQCNGWIAFLYFARVLTQDEVDQLAANFEGVTGYNPEISCWGDSNAAYDPDIRRYPLRLVKDFRPGWRGLDGGVFGNSSTQIKTRFLADPRKWRGFNIFQSSNGVLLQDFIDMVALLGHSRYIVMGQHNDAITQQSGTTEYNDRIAFNLTLAAQFGANYFDSRAYLISLNTSPGDDDDTAADSIGASQRGVGDGIHLNAVGQANLAAKLDLLITALGVLYP